MRVFIVLELRFEKNDASRRFVSIPVDEIHLIYPVDKADYCGISHGTNKHFIHETVVKGNVVDVTNRVNQVQVSNGN